MKLLVITQKIDRNDPILGFFHRWVEEFSKHCEKITVICLWKGEYNLPGNVKVISLGKENGKSRLKYIINFYKYTWRERKNYDAVFVHMNQEYILLGCFFWKILGKKIFLWRNHAKGNLMTRIAVLVSDKVFCTSPQSFTARFAKTKTMPAGIDTDFFKFDQMARRKPNSILFLGRIAPVKNVDIFIEALRELKNMGTEFSVTIAGGRSSKDVEYEKMIRDKVLSYRLSDKITFTGAVSQSESLKLYREHELYVNLTPQGSMDKTIFEAIASGSAVLVSNIFFNGKLPDGWVVSNYDDPKALALAIKSAMRDAHNYNFNARKDVASLVEKHALKNLARELVDVITTIATKKK